MIPRSTSRWGLSILLLTKSASASTAWHHNRRAEYRDYSKSGRRSGGPTSNSRSAIFGGLFAKAEAVNEDEETCSDASASCRAERSAKVDCCTACHEYMTPQSLAKQCSALPRGGHVHTHSSSAAAETVAAALPLGIHLNLWKIIFQTLLTTINVLCWLLPLRSKKMTSNKLALSLANAFSGGVFLSLAFGHLLPECVEGFQHSITGEFNEALPYMIVLGGYLLIFFVEKVAFDAHEIMHEMEHGGHDHTNGETQGQNGIVRKESSGGGTGRGAVILLGALAVHSILEMTALGLADTFGDSALLTLSIALHQPAESIALLVAFLKSGMPKPQIIKFLSIFSCMGPIGVAIGMAVNNFASPLVDAVMLAVVAGTFVYVGATEVIPEEWEDSEHKWKKFFALISGIVSIFAITQYTMSLESI